MSFKNIHVQLTGNATSLKTAMSSAGRDVDTFDGKVQKLDRRMGKAKVALAAVGTAAAAMAVTGLGVGVKMAIDFEREMRNVNTIAKVSEDSFASMKEEVLDLSTRVPQSANVLAQGLYDISSSGFAGAEGLEVLEASATAAAAGMTTTDVAAKGVTAVLNAYGLAAEESADVSDIMFKTVEQGVITFAELSGEMGDIVGIGAAAGLSFDQMASAMAAITKAGVPAAQASTSLSRLVQNFIDPADELGSLLAEWGYESGTAALQQEGLYEIMMRVQDATGGNAEELMALFPNIRATRAAFALLANEGENYAGTAGAIEDANSRAGASQDALEEQSKSLAFQWDMLTSSMSAGAIRMGELMIPTLNSLIQGAAELADKGFPALMDAVGHLEPVFDDLADVGYDVVNILGDLWDVAGPVVRVLAQVTFATLIGGLRALSATLSAVTGFFADNEAAMFAVATVLGAMLVPAVGALITKLQVMLVMGVVNALGAMGTAAAGASGGFTALAASVGAMNLALAAIVVGAGAAIYETQQLKKEMDELAESQLAAFGQEFDETTNTGRIQRWRAQISGTSDELERLREIQEGAVDPFSMEPGTDFEGYLQSLSLGASKVIPFWTSQAERDWEHFLALEEEVGEAADRAAQAMGTINAAATAIREELGQDLSAEAISELADVLGIDLATAARDEAVPALIDAAAAADEGDEAYSSATTALEELTTAHEEATAALQEYADTQRALFDPLFAVQDALNDVAEAQTAADEALAEHGRDSAEFAQASRDVASALLDQDAAMADLRLGLQDGTVSMDQAIDQLFLWAQNGDLGTESTMVLVDMIGDLIGASEDWADGNYEAILTADERAAMEALDNADDRLDEFDRAKAVAEADLDDSGAIDSLTELQRYLAAVDGFLATATVRVIEERMPSGRYTPPHLREEQERERESLVPGGGVLQADGGVLEFYANGGTRERHMAQIAPAGSWRVWAEPETGGEAYIPLAQSKRSRSMAILQEVANRFGQQITPASSMYAGPGGGGGGAAGSNVTHDNRQFTAQVIERDKDDSIMALRKMAARMV